MNKTLFPCIVSTDGYLESIIRDGKNGVYIAHSEIDLVTICKKYVLDHFGQKHFIWNGVIGDQFNFMASEYFGEKLETYNFTIIPLISPWLFPAILLFI